MKKTVKILLSAITGLFLPFLASAQDFVLPSLPTSRLEDHSPLFHAVQPNRFNAELNTTQQHMALKGHPQTYRLSLSGTPAALTYDHAALTFHGDVYSTHSGFRYDVHGSFGMTAAVRVAPDWQLLADLNYDFGYRHYAFHDVITEHPEYTDVPYHRYFHTPAVSLGFVYAGQDYRLGFAATGAAALPGNDFSASGTFFYEQHLGAYTNAHDRMATLLPYLNYTYYAYDHTGHTVTAGLNARYGFFHACVLYRGSKDVQTGGLGIGFDFGKYCHLGYRFLIPFRFNGIMAGVAAHHLTFQVALPQKKNHR